MTDSLKILGRQSQVGHHIQNSDKTHACGRIIIIIITKQQQLTLIKHKLCMRQGFSGGTSSKNLPLSAGDSGSIPGSVRSPRGAHGNPLQYSCLENPHGQRSLVGYSPWGHKEMDTTERLGTGQQSSAKLSALSKASFPTRNIFGISSIFQKNRSPQITIISRLSEEKRYVGIK